MGSLKIKSGAIYSDLTIADKRKHLWQWDTGCKINLTGLPSVEELHYFRHGFEQPYALKVYEKDGQRLCNIPDEILQTSEDFQVFAYIIEADGNQTWLSKTFSVKERPRPTDYVYTETEFLTYKNLEARIEELENSGGFGTPLPEVTTKDDGKVLKVKDGKWTVGANGTFNLKTDDTLTLNEDSVLSVNTTDVVEKDNTLPITASAVYTTVGNIEVLLKTI